MFPGALQAPDIWGAPYKKKHDGDVDDQMVTRSTKDKNLSLLGLLYTTTNYSVRSSWYLSVWSAIIIIFTIIVIITDTIITSIVISIYIRMSAAT